MSTTPLDHHFDVSGIQIQIREYQADAPSVVFLHFGGGNLMMWQRAIPLFEERYHLILIDLRGHGKSDKPPEGNHIDTMAEDVIAVLDLMKIDQCAVIGSSLGAEVGLAMATHHPERVSALVCEGALYSEFGPYGVFPGTEAEFSDHIETQIDQLMRDSSARFPSKDALIDSTRIELEKLKWWNEEFRVFLEYDADEVAPGWFSSGWARESMRGYFRNYFHFRFEDYYRQIQCPILMVPSGQETRDPRKKAAMEGLCKLARNARIVMIDRWIHAYGWLIEPEPICHRILDFFSDRLVVKGAKE